MSIVVRSRFQSLITVFCSSLVLAACNLLPGSGSGGKDMAMTASAPYSFAEMVTIAPHGANDLAASGTALYVATTAGVDVYDATQPLSHGVVAHLDVSDAVALAVHGGRLYVGTAAVYVFDLTNPLSPTAMGTITTGAVGRKTLVVDDTYVWAGTANFGVRRTPLAGGTSVSFNANGEVNTLVGNGSAIFVANLTDGVVRGYDVTRADPDAQVAVTTLSPMLPGGSGQLFPWALFLDGKTLYVTGNGSLAAYDVTDPSKPMALTTHQTGINGPTTRQNIGKHGSWIVTQGLESPIFWEVSDPTNFVGKPALGAVSLTPITSLVFAGDKLYLADATMLQAFAPN